MAPPLTKEELELQCKFDLIKRKRQELQNARAAAAPATAAVSVKRPSTNVPVGNIEAARKVLESEAKKPKMEKKTKDVNMRPLEDDRDQKTPEVKPFVSVFQGGGRGAPGSRRDYHNRFVSGGNKPTLSPKKRFLGGLDESSSTYKSASVQVTGCDLTEDLLVNHFGDYGEMDLVKVDATGRRGFVTFKNSKSAAKSVEKSNGTKLEGIHIGVTQIDPEAIQAADFSKEALSSPWASLAAGVAIHRKEGRREQRTYGETFMYDSLPDDI